MQFLFSLMKKKRAGFSLVEILVALAILGFITLAVFQLCRHSQIAWRKTEEKDEALHSLRIALDRMTREVRLASSLTTDCSRDILSFYNAKGELIKYSLSQATVYRKVGTASKVPLANNVTDLHFTYLPTGVEPYQSKLVQFHIVGKTRKTSPVEMDTSVFVRMRLANE